MDYIKVDYSLFWDLIFERVLNDSYLSEDAKNVVASYFSELIADDVTITADMFHDILRNTEVITPYDEGYNEISTHEVGDWVEYDGGDFNIEYKCEDGIMLSL